MTVHLDLGHLWEARVGDTVKLHTPAGIQEIDVIGISYGAS